MAEFDITGYLKDLKSLFIMAQEDEVAWRVAEHIYKKYPEPGVIQSVRIRHISDGEAVLVNTVGNSMYQQGHKIPVTYGPIQRAKKEVCAIITPDSHDYDPSIEGDSRYYALLYLKPKTLISVELSPAAIENKEKAGRMLEMLARRFDSSVREESAKTAMRHAREVQSSLVPSAIVAAGYDIAHRYEPSKVAGGDFLVFERTDDRNFVLAIGDSEGKGLEAAYNAVRIVNLFRGIMIGNPAAELNVPVEKLNASFVPGKDRIATMFAGKFRKDGRVSYVNAGHTYPILVDKQGQLVEWTERDLLLGVSGDEPYNTVAKTFSEGDVLFLSTDGFTESMNEEEKEWYPAKRLHNVLREMRNLPAAEIVKAAWQDCKNFRGSQELFDDTLVFAMKYHG